MFRPHEHVIRFVNHKHMFSVSLKERLRAKYKDKEILDKLDDKFIQLRLQKFELEVLPDILTERDLVMLEKLRQRSPVVPYRKLFSKLEDDEKDAPKKILIRGRPGVGKTTFVEFIAREWAKGNLWPEIHYLFVIKLRKLLQTAKWSLCDLLIGDLHLSDHDKMVALEEIRKHSHQTLCIMDGIDEMKSFVFNPVRFTDERVDLSMLISNVISSGLLPDAKVILTTRPTELIPPVEEFGRVIDIYGFTRDGINNYVDTFCAGKEELRQYIQLTIESNPNIATFCHTPILCCFVCETLAGSDDHPNHSSDQEMKTMTQLFVKAAHRHPKQLHPSLKGPSRKQNLTEIFHVLKKPLQKHVALAKDGMTMPLKLTFDDDDLAKYEFTEEDKQTGFLSGSEKIDPDDDHTTTNTWSFSHLTLQEFFGAYGLLQEPHTDILALLNNEVYRKQNEMVITFLLGLLGDIQNEYFLKYLGSVAASLDLCKEIIKILSTTNLDDPLKLVTFVYETQKNTLVEYVPEEIKTREKTIYPMEMSSLCWLLQQDTCRVTQLW